MELEEKWLSRQGGAAYFPLVFHSSSSVWVSDQQRFWLKKEKKNLFPGDVLWQIRGQMKLV